MLSSRATDVRPLAAVSRLGLWSFVRIISFDTTCRASVVPTLRWARSTTFHDVINLVTVDGFVLHQSLSHGVELFTIINQNLPRLLVAGINNVAHFFVNPLSGFRRVDRLRLSSRATQKRFFAICVVLQRPKLL